jgi:hypothetical protein
MFAVLLFAPALMLADDASKAAKIEELCLITHMDQLSQQIIDQIAPIVKTQMGNVPAEQRAAVNELMDKLTTLIANRLNWDSLKPAFVKLYSDTYTEEEVEGMIVFYKTPVGRAMLEKMPALMQKAMAISQDTMRDILPEIQRSIEEIKRKYDK